MPNIRHPRGLAPNRGTSRPRRRTSARRAVYRLEGTVRFVAPDGTRIAVLVHGGNAHGRRLLGRTVTLELAQARLGVADRNADGAISMADLLPGDLVTARARMAAEPAELPEVIAVRSITAVDPAAR